MGVSDRPKVMCALLGKPMLAYVLQAVAASGIDSRPVVVVGHMAGQVQDFCAGACEYAEQPELKGTGDAVLRTRPLLEGAAENVFVLCGDQPFVSASTIRKIVDMHLASGATLTFGTASVEDFEGWRAPFADFGRILRDASGRPVGMVEVKDATPDQLAIREVNPSLYCFRAAWLWKALETLTNANAQGEYYLVDVLAKAVATGEKIMTVPVAPEEALGINTTSQLAIAEKLMQDRN